MSTLALTRPAVLSRPNWVKLSFAGILVLAAGLCLWNLTISGYSNEYYAAAARSGSESWKAWFFGAIDPGSFITVDKPPLSLWLSGLSARVFGFSSFSVLLPQALCTIAAVGALFATVRRVAGDAPALIAALAFALSPIAIAVARVNNPDALLVLLLVLERVLHRPRARVRPHQAPRHRRRARRPGVHDQDAPGLDDRAGAGRCLRSLRAGRRVDARAAAARSRAP